MAGPMTRRWSGCASPGSLRATPACKRICCVQIQREILATAPYAPLGQIKQPTAYRSDVTGVLPGFCKFWNVTLG